MKRLFPILFLSMALLLAPLQAQAASALERDRVTDFQRSHSPSHNNGGGRWYQFDSRCVTVAANHDGQPSTAAIGCFLGDGDYIGLNDWLKDGRRIGVHWKTDYGRRGLCVSTEGFDKIAAGEAMLFGHVGCNKNMKESGKVRIRVGVCRASKRNCRKIRNWNWSGWSPRIAISET